MNGLILYATRYGSTAQYARWIAEATGLEARDVRRAHADREAQSFFVLGGPIIYHKLACHRWVKRNLPSLLSRPVILFTVSGAGAGPKLDGWLAASLPGDFLAHADHVALRGRQNPRELTLYDRTMLIIGGLTNRDRTAAREEIRGFDFMDKDSIAPIVDKVRRLQHPHRAAS